MKYSHEDSLKMELTAKRMDLLSGGKKIIVLNNKDAEFFDLKPVDRVRIWHDHKSVIAIIDISEKFVKKGTAGCFEEVFKSLGLKEKDKIRVEPVPKPETVNLIKAKMQGRTLTSQEIDKIIKDVMEEKLSDIELTAFMTSVYIRGFNDAETVSLTKSIVNSGTTLKLNKDIILDKHCIGGVPGNRTTMLLVPIIAGYGMTIPKTSSRAITSPAGTADVMEVLAPVSLKEEEIEEVVKKANGCITWGGAVNLAAADDKLIRVRVPLGLDPPGVLLASIMAKKKAVGATHVLIDIPIGRGAKIPDEEKAKELARDFMEIGSQLDMSIHCIITPGYDPVGFAVGPAIEAREILRILEGKRVSTDLRDKAVIMSGKLLKMSGKTSQEEGEKAAEHLISSGKALEKLKEIIELQGGDPKVTSDDVQVGDKQVTVKAHKKGRIQYINTRSITAIARAAGAPKSKGAGVYMHVEKGDKLKRGQPLFTIYAESEQKIDVALDVMNRMPPVEFEKVILEELSTEEELKPYMLEFH